MREMRDTWPVWVFTFAGFVLAWVNVALGLRLTLVPVTISAVGLAWQYGYYRGRRHERRDRARMDLMLLEAIGEQVREECAADHPARVDLERNLARLRREAR